MLCEKLNVVGEPSERVEAVDMSPDKTDGGLAFDQILSEVPEKVVEGAVVRRTVVSHPERPDQRVLRILEKLFVGDAPLARVELVNFTPEAIQGFEEMSEVVFARIEIQEEVVLVDRGVVEARVAAVEREDHFSVRGVFGAVPWAFLEALDGGVARKLSTGRLTV